MDVVGSDITALPLEKQIDTMVGWAQKRESRSVCVANVHMLMEAHWQPQFAEILAKADLVTPDGMPLVWMMRLMGVAQQDRVAGMDLFTGLCKSAQDKQISVFFVGSHREVLERIKVNLHRDFPKLMIAGMEPLPFRPLEPHENEQLVENINTSGAGLVFVALGCPKQEHWTAQQRGKIQAVMVGVGAVFPVYAGIYKRAPRWLRESGWEWFYRLMQEPKRLWIRYRKTIPPFVWLACKQLLHKTYPLKAKISTLAFRGEGRGNGE